MNPITQYFKRIMHPAWYHGHQQKGPFFEGWYFKCIDLTTDHRWAIIPGVFLGDDPHAFIQVLNGTTNQSWYHRYPVTDFWAASDSFAVHIGESKFSPRAMSLHIDRPDQVIHGRLTFTNPTPWPVSLFSPGIMGWYAWVPTMECYHGVPSLDHAISGELQFSDSAIDFTGGRGYIEKDWGRSFPSAWIWMQSNHFMQPGTSLTASIAMIPWRFTRFRGFIVGLWHNESLYRFATYTGARTVTLAVDDNQVRWTLQGKTNGGDYELQIRATRGTAGFLAGPTEIDMGKRVAESLTAVVHVRLVHLLKRHKRDIFVGEGSFAGLELFNVTAELLDPD